MIGVYCDTVISRLSSVGWSAARAWFCAATIAAGLWPSDGRAIDRLALTIRAVRAATWQADKIQLELALQGDSGRLQIGRLQLPEPIGEVQGLDIACAKLVMTDAGLDCPRANFRVKSKRLDGQQFGGSFYYGQQNDELGFRLADLPLGGTKVTLSAQSRGDTWSFSLQAPALTLNSTDGKLATDKLALRLSGSARRRPDGWGFTLKLAAATGQAYVEPVFMDFVQAPLQFAASGRWQAAQSRLLLEALDFRHDHTLRAQGALSLSLGKARRLESMSLRLHEIVLPRAYAGYLQPFLIGTALDDLETGGRASGNVTYAQGAPQSVKLTLEQLQLDDRKHRFALYGVQGDVHWQSNAAQRSLTKLRWEGGSAWRVDLGTAELSLLTAGRRVSLPAETRLPVLDGHILLRKLELSEIGTAAMRVGFDAVLAPVSMERVCRALEWPVFSGTLSGAIPAVEYHEGKLTAGGTLSAKVFDGSVEVDKLRLEQPFGARPRLAADMKLRRIDLESATSAFSFGRIEGRLDGDVKDLRLLKWQPVAFDGRLYTTPGDDSRHRISQRAIENISDLGGAGAAGVLSRGFLRFFEDFAYDRIALGCRLRDGVCVMSGLEPHRSGGYYIVKGKLVPRIDVIGFAPRVSWDALVRQLKEIRRSEGPVIK